MVKEIHSTMVLTTVLFTVEATMSIYMSRMETIKVPMAAMIWLTVRLEMNTPMEIMAPPYSRVPI